MYSAATGRSIALTVEPSKLLASGPNGATLIHWGSLIDMIGYLSMAAVVVYFRDRYASSRYVDLFAAAMATAAPALINDYSTASAPQKQALLPAFATLYRAVVLGLWQTLEASPLTVWLLGTASIARRNGPRSVFLILLVLGVVIGAIALYRLVAVG